MADPDPRFRKADDLHPIFGFVTWGSGFGVAAGVQFISCTWELPLAARPGGMRICEMWASLTQEGQRQPAPLPGVSSRGFVPPGRDQLGLSVPVGAPTRSHVGAV